VLKGRDQDILEGEADLLKAAALKSSARGL